MRASASRERSSGPGASGTVVMESSALDDPPTVLAAAAGMSPAPAGECKPPSCRTDAVGPDTLAECPTLLRGGLSCGEDFCNDDGRCELAGMCTRSRRY